MVGYQKLQRWGTSSGMAFIPSVGSIVRQGQMLRRTK